MTKTPTTPTADRDVQLVRELADIVGLIPIDVFDTLPNGLPAAINAVFEQFQDRIETLDARDRNRD